jgi:isopenicillin-N epimerase
VIEYDEEDTGRFGSRVRKEWLLEPQIHFLNHGSFGATPRRVLAAAAAWRERCELQPVRFMVRELPPLLRNAAEELGVFVGAEPSRLAFVDNATSGVNAVLRSFDLRRGDRVVTTTHVYPAVRNAIRFVCERAGAKYVEVPIPFPIERAEQPLEALSVALRPGARLAVLDHICSASALVLPIAEMTALCRDYGVPVLVDGAHAPGHLDLDIESLGADWYTGNAHKWMFAAKGCAFLWASAGRWPTLKPTVISHATSGTEAFDWPGTRDFSPWLSVTEALAFYQELGEDNVRHHNRQLALWAGRMLADAWGVEIPCPESMIGAMVSLPAPGRHEPTQAAADALHNKLWEEHRVEVPVFPFADRLWIRISAQVYNQKYQYRVLAEALKP